MRQRTLPDKIGSGQRIRNLYRAGTVSVLLKSFLPQCYSGNAPATLPVRFRAFYVVVRCRPLLPVRAGGADDLPPPPRAPRRRWQARPHRGPVPALPQQRAPLPEQPRPGPTVRFCGSLASGRRIANLPALDSEATGGAHQQPAGAAVGGVGSAWFRNQGNASGTTTKKPSHHSPFGHQRIFNGALPDEPLFRTFCAASAAAHHRGR